MDRPRRVTYKSDLPDESGEKMKKEEEEDKEKKEANSDTDEEEGDSEVDEDTPLSDRGRFKMTSKRDFLHSDSNGDLNYHTYVYDANKSFRAMTMEALPVEDNYRDLFDLTDGGQKRPTIEELKSGQIINNAAAKVEEQPLKPDDVKTGKVVKFGWITGVFMRCLLNIWGVMLFLRLSTIIGQCGIVQGLLVITLCNVVTLITSISMSAVATNGVIKGGGIYYMISRSLGPEFGGAIGIMFTVANSIAVATYLIGFCDAMIDMIAEYQPSFFGIVGTLDNRANDIRIIGTVVLIAILALAVVGMDWVTRVQIVLLVMLVLSQLDFIIGSFLPAEEEKAKGFVGYSSEVLKQNLLTTNYHDYKSDKEPTFFYWFGVFFPAVTGIVAGANLSGDLKDPSTAIPKGTILAIMMTYVTYIGYGFMIGSCYLSEASGNVTEYQAWLDGNESVIYFNQCGKEFNRTCQFGSSNDQQTFSKISYTGILVYIGCFAATLSSAIASLVGAPRVLQALAKDKLYPLIGFFGVGYGANDDPFRGYVLVFFIALGCTMLGNLDLVSTLLSNFFVAAYALINFSVFHATITKSPGWRPSFKYYNSWVSLMGTILCIGVMFLMDWTTALITFTCVLVLYLYISYRKPEANWGSSTQAQQFLLALKSVQTLNESEDHVKNYRPKILVLSGIPAHRLPLVDFANLITKKLSLLIFAHVAENLPLSAMDSLKNSVNIWLKDHRIKAFFTVTVNKSFHKGAMSQMNLSGLGKLSPNMVLMGYKADWQKDGDSCEEYYNTISHGFDLHMAMAILRLNNGCDFSDEISVEEDIVSKDYDPEQDEEETTNNGTSWIQKASFRKIRGSKKSPTTKVVYKGSDGKPLSDKILKEVTQFQGTASKAYIDVWWLYDAGGLNLLLPYILTTRNRYANCKLRIFSLANKKDELDKDTRNLASLLSKFRIDYSDVKLIPNITAKALDETKEEFKDIIDNSDAKVSDTVLITHKEKTNRHLRLTEELRQHSTDAELVIMTLPMPRKDIIPAPLYMAWLEIMTRNMPPFLFARGNQTSVLTFYS